MVAYDRDDEDKKDDKAAACNQSELIEPLGKTKGYFGHEDGCDCPICEDMIWRSRSIPSQDENFCRIFELPQQYPEGFLFNGGKPVTMLMVDWFNPWPHLLEPDKCPKTWEEVKVLLLPWMLEKPYVKPGKKYLMVTNFGEAWVFGHRA